MSKYEEDLTIKIEGDFLSMLDVWHSLPEIWDNDLDAQIHRWYSDPPKLFPKRPYFSPSGLGSCPRELYLKAKRAKKDNHLRPPHQARWANMGTAAGDVIQRDLLRIEKHFESRVGKAPRFKFLRDEQGRPRFEEFAGANVKIKHNDEEFYLYGFPDGIMTYTTDDGEEIRVGLEIKTKSTTPAQTSNYSMRGPDPNHERQARAYAVMYGCDYYVVLYVNLAKKAWNMSDEDYQKTPDIRAFCLDTREPDYAELFDKPADITKRVREGNPPKLDVEEWTFNNFKEACALDLSDEEYTELLEMNHKAQHSSMKEFEKKKYAEAVRFISAIRGYDRKCSK